MSRKIEYWYLTADDSWHKQSHKRPDRSACGRPWDRVSRVTSTPPSAGHVCDACAQTRAQGKLKRQPKALRAKIAELRARGVREDLVGPLARDQLARQSDRSRSVRTVSGGLPTLGKRD